jgi:hypothetical protein
MTDGLITDVRGKHLTVKVLKHTGGYQSDVLFGGLEAKYFDLILPDAENKQETV